MNRVTVGTYRERVYYQGSLEMWHWCWEMKDFQHVSLWYEAERGCDQVKPCAYTHI